MKKHVDHLFFTGKDQTMFDKFKKSMMAEFYMSDLERIHYFLGIEVVQSNAGIFISQKRVCARDSKKVSKGGLQSGLYIAERSLQLVKDDKF